MHQMTRLGQGQQNGAFLQKLAGDGTMADRRRRSDATARDYSRRTVVGNGSMRLDSAWHVDGNRVNVTTDATKHPTMSDRTDATASFSSNFNEAFSNDSMDIDRPSRQDDEMEEDGYMSSQEPDVVNPTSWAQDHDPNLTTNFLPSGSAYRLETGSSVVVICKGLILIFLGSPQRQSSFDSPTSRQTYGRTNPPAILDAPYGSRSPSLFTTQDHFYAPYATAAPGFFPPIQPKPRCSAVSKPYSEAGLEHTVASHRRRGRDGPLSKAAKASAARVRLKGACARCHRMKEKVCASNGDQQTAYSSSAMTLYLVVLAGIPLGGNSNFLA